MWKFLYTTDRDFLLYTIRKLNSENYKKITLKDHKNTTITRLNYIHAYSLYQGKYTITRFLKKFHIGYKLGELTKTRKPFYFRSKKKK